jgi:hypothetical protein
LKSKREKENIINNKKVTEKREVKRKEKIILA